MSAFPIDATSREHCQTDPARQAIPFQPFSKLEVRRHRGSVHCSRSDENPRLRQRERASNTQTGTVTLVLIFIHFPIPFHSYLNIDRKEREKVKRVEHYFAPHPPSLPKISLFRPLLASLIQRHRHEKKNGTHRETHKCHNFLLLLLPRSSPCLPLSCLQPRRHQPAERAQRHDNNELWQKTCVRGRKGKRLRATDTRQGDEATRRERAKVISVEAAT